MTLRVFHDNLIMWKAITKFRNDTIGSKVIAGLIVMAVGAGVAAIWAATAHSFKHTMVLVVTVLLVLCSAGFVYVYFARTESKLVVGNEPVRHKKFSKTARRWALFGVVVNLLFVCTGLVFWKYSTRSQISPKTVTSNTTPTTTPPGVSVWIADFPGPDPDEYGVTRILLDELDDISTEHVDIRINHLHEQIEARAIAQKRGKELKANIVIWGHYVTNKSRARVTAYFTMLDAPDVPPLKDEKVRIKSSNAQLENFTIQDSVSDRMRYLILVTSAVSYYAAGDYTRAVEKFDSAIAMQAKNQSDLYACYFYRGSARSFNGNYKGAIEDLSKSIELYPRFPEAYNNLGNAFAQLGNEEKAIDSYRKAIVLKEDHANAYANLGAVYLERRSFEQADVELKKAIQYQPQHRIAHLLLAESSYEQGRYDEAINILNEELKRGEDAVIYSSLGLSYCSKGDPVKGIPNLLKALATAPDSAAVRSNVARAYADIGNFQEARIHFDKAVELQPSFVQYHDRAIFNYFAGDPNRAVNDFKKSIEIDPGFADSYFGLSYAFMSLGQGALAANAAETYIRLRGWQDQRSQYMALVEHFGYRQSGNNKDAKPIVELAAKSADKSVWPYPLFNYLLGKTSAKEIINSTLELQERESPFSKTEPGATALALVPNRSRATAARTYIGLDLALGADANQALIHLQWVQSNGEKDVYEYRLALSMLNQLKSR